MEYEINLLDVIDLEFLLSDSKILSKLIYFEVNDKFKNFLAQKCIDEVKKITKENLSDLRTGDYESYHKSKVDDTYITIYNNSMVDLSGLSNEFRNNYSNGLSLAMLVEFGMGIGGTSNEVWQTKVNPNRDYEKGWLFINDYGQWIWTNGSEGKFIYLKLKEAIEENATDWLIEYLNSNVEGSELSWI